jgi:hypothetical protein
VALYNRRQTRGQAPAETRKKRFIHRTGHCRDPQTNSEKETLAALIVDKKPSVELFENKFSMAMRDYMLAESIQ